MLRGIKGEANYTRFYMHMGINQSNSIAVRDTAHNAASTVPFTLELLRTSDLLFHFFFVVMLLRLGGWNVIELIIFSFVALVYTN